MSVNDSENVLKLAQRSSTLVASCLAVVVLVLVICLAVVVAVAADAASTAASAQQANDDLRSELTCRSVAATEFDIIQGQLAGRIATGLAQLAENDEAGLEGTAELLKVEAEALTAAAVARRSAQSTCATDGAPAED